MSVTDPVTEKIFFFRIEDSKRQVWGNRILVTAVLLDGQRGLQGTCTFSIYRCLEHQKGQDELNHPALDISFEQSIWNERIEPDTPGLLEHISKIV